MPAVARLGDSSSHGGHIITGSSNVHINGIPAARVGDLHSCPRTGHGTTAIVSSGAVTERCNGSLYATVGSTTGCGATIVAGSPDRNIR